MIKKITLIASIFLIYACTEKQKSNAIVEVADTEITMKNDDIENEAQAWLVKNITNYFATEEVDALDSFMQKMTTADYYEYKTDATNVGLDIDGSLTEAQFREKWKNKFDVSEAGIGTGFLISGQDWDKIEVEKCDLISAKYKEFLFDVILKDEAFQSKYPSKIRVINSAGVYKIADVVGEH